MKNILAKPIVLAAAALLTTTFSIAQPNSWRTDRNNRNGSATNRIRTDIANRDRNLDNRPNVHSSPLRNIPSPQRSILTPQRNVQAPQRNFQPRTTNVSSRPVVRQSSYRNPVVINNYNRNYDRAPRYTVGVPYYGQRFNRINHPYVNIVYGGYNYQYYGGVFYRPFGSYYQVIAPPFGIRINVLPVGYYRFNWRNNHPYYYYNGVFYNQYNNYYEVTQPPMGAKLPNLPAGAKAEIINGRKYYEYNGTFYAEEFNTNNEILYTVVGVNGVLDNAEVAQLPVYINPAPLQSVPTDQTPLTSNGIISSLPANCKIVEENGQKYYLSPQNIYYQEIVSQEGLVSYQTVNISASPSSY